MMTMALVVGFKGNNLREEDEIWQQWRGIVLDVY